MRGTFGRDALGVYSTEHARCHSGEMFKAGVNSASLGAASFLYLELIIPTDRQVHLKPVVLYNSLAATYDIIEAPTITDGNSAVAKLNRLRSSIKASGLVIWSNPTAISAGTTLDIVNFTGELVSPDGTLFSDMEWVLKANTKYVLRLQNNGGGASTAFMRINWYEELL
jgi:hypothetical protein